jgi:hypothetical protein
VDLPRKNAESSDAIALLSDLARARQRALRASAACKGREVAEKACFAEALSGHSKQTQQHQNGLFRLLLQTVDSVGALKQGPTSRGDEPSAQAIGSKLTRRDAVSHSRAARALRCLLARFDSVLLACALRERHPELPHNLF